MNTTGLPARADRTLTARVTYYDGESCKFGNKTSTGVRAKQGVTVAVDPFLFAYGSVIEINSLKGKLGNGVFLAQDTGSAVKSRKASKKWGRLDPVIDVFVNKKDMVKILEHQVPMFVKIKVRA